MSILKILLLNLIVLHQGGMIAKLKATFVIASITSPMALALDHVNKWYFDNYDYVAFVFVAVMFDHLLGTWVHAFIKKDFSIKKNILGFFTKTMLVVIVGVLVEGVTNRLGSGEFLAEYFSLMARLMVFIYPAGSALMNCSIITNGKFPPTAFMKRIMNFNKDLDIKKLTNEPTDNE